MAWPLSQKLPSSWVSVWSTLVYFYRTDPPDKIQNIIDIVRASTSKVIITFLSPMELCVLMHEFFYHNLTGYQWVGTEAWRLQLDGAIGLSIPKAHVSGMREFMLDAKPFSSSGNELFTERWETFFSCKFNMSKSSSENVLDMKM